MKIVMILTSHDKLGTNKSGLWLEEFAKPYYIFKDAGFEVILASPQGAQPSIDSRSNNPSTNATYRFKSDLVTQLALRNTVKLEDVVMDDVNALFYVGGHGALWDLAGNSISIKMIANILASGGAVAAVGHATSVFCHVKQSDGTSLINGKAITGSSLGEDDLAGLTQILPSSVENLLKANGGRYSHGRAGEPFIITDGLIITGQNRASSELVAQSLVASLAHISRKTESGIHQALGKSTYMM